MFTTITQKEEKKERRKERNKGSITGGSSKKYVGRKSRSKQANKAIVKEKKEKVGIIMLTNKVRKTKTKINVTKVKEKTRCTNG